MVNQTYNYEQFKLNKLNREISEKNLKKIDRSVKEKGWLQHPITVNKYMEVMDGQHRLMYAKEHNLPVYYTVVDDLTMEDCVVMNNERTSWNLMDYIRYYAGCGNDNYIILKSLAETYSFLPMTIITSIIKGTFSGGNASRTIKTGKFEITSREYKIAVDKMEFLAKCSNSVLGAKGRASAYFHAIAFAYDCPGVDRNVLLKKVQNDIGIVTPPANVEMAVKGIEELYNYRLSRKNYVYIAAEYKKSALARVAGKKEEE